MFWVILKWMDDLAGVRSRFRSLEGVLDERSRRLLAAAESKAWGRGGISAVSRVTGMSRPVIRQGLRELLAPAVHPVGRIRRPGGGRKKARQKDPTLVADLEQLVEPTTRGHPETCLRWTCKSVRKLAEELNRLGHPVSYPVVAELLHELDYRLQANRKTKEGDSHPDRDAQFEYIDKRVQAYLGLRQPVIAVDTKKKEWVGDFKNVGQAWRPKGDPEKVRVHDFAIPELGRAAPYGVYDLAYNTGWVSVGVDHDTASFAVETIRRWWYAMGQEKYPRAEKLLITADGGGSNGSRRTAVESRVAEASRRNRAGHRGESFSPRHQQVEQDRTPSVLLHQQELAGAAPHQSKGDRQPYRRNNDPKGTEGSRAD